jgi:ketosteroid isomerase-like protein
VSLSISDLRAIGDKVFLAATGTGRGKRSKVPFEQPVWFVTTHRDGLDVRLETYLDPHGSPRSRRAAGVGVVAGRTSRVA